MIFLEQTLTDFLCKKNASMCQLELLSAMETNWLSFLSGGKIKALATLI